MMKSKEELVLENAEVQQNNSSNQIPVPDSPATISSENTASMKELPLQKPTTDSNPRNEQEKVPSPSSDVNNLETRRAGHGVAVTGIIKLEPTPPTECADVQESTADAEPEFQSPKERECWQLYRRMVEKGVSVSYDTVLRGMLTPTEYRLRRNALLSTTVRQLV
ncbi:hypothetical protein C0J52_20680 [Blattella germanica]|nr:hypothetical protein C0J52_20680 [Blattella germanica]